MLKYLFVDESGDLGFRGSKYIVIACVIIDNPAPLDRIIKNMRRYKFKKELKKTHEIKASKSSDALVKHMIGEFNTIENANTYFMVLEKEKLFSSFLKNNKHKLYNFIAGKLAEKILLGSFNIEIRIDKSKGKQILQEDFNIYFCSKLEKNSSINRMTIHHSYSHSWSGLQFADVLAWACFQKFENKNGGYIGILKEGKREMFNLFKKKNSTFNH